jgi:hypothetical protein
MALFDIKDETAKGLAIGLGVAVLAPLALTALSGFGRPAARAAIKAGLIMYEKGRETFAEMGEVFDDLVAEARAEMHPPPATETQAVDTGETVAKTTEPPPGEG